MNWNRSRRKKKKKKTEKKKEKKTKKRKRKRSTKINPITPFNLPNSARPLILPNRALQAFSIGTYPHGAFHIFMALWIV